MSISQPVCEYCKQPLKLKESLADREGDYNSSSGHNDNYICVNENCPDKHNKINCPNCNSSNVTMKNFNNDSNTTEVFECKNCSYIWEASLSRN